MYTNEEITTLLGVGNAGGVRVKIAKNALVRRLVLMTSKPSSRQIKENPYHDRVENDVLVYTGAGLEGDQTLGGANKRIPTQAQYEFPIYGFQIIANRRDQSVGSRRWQFLGMLKYLRHYPETQIDTAGRLRKVWLFEFRVHSKPEVIFPEKDYEVSQQIFSNYQEEIQSNADEESIAEAMTASEPITPKFIPEELEIIRKKLLAQSPEQFEEFISLVLRSTGYERVTVTTDVPTIKTS